MDGTPEGMALAQATREAAAQQKRQLEASKGAAGSAEGVRAACMRSLALPCHCE